MLLSPLKISPTTYYGSAFSIANSFYLDGVDEYFTIPNASLINTIAGTNKQFTLNFVFKRQNIGVLQHLIANYTSGTDFSIYVAITTVNKLQFTIYDGVLARNLITNETITNQQIWYHVTVKYDGVTPSNSKIIINGVDSTYSSNTLTSTIFNSSTIFKIGNALTYYVNVYFQSMYLVDRIVTDEENTNHYNNGKPKNPQSLFGTNCKFFFNSDNSGDTAQFSVVDSVNSITATSVNMEDADKTPLTPYANPIADLVAKYGFLNAWSAENIGINGTTTTVYDYLGEHNLSNPAVANQPTFVGGSSVFNNRPVLVSDGIDDYLYKAVANWRGSDNSGFIVMVYDDDGVGVNNTAYAISTSDEGTANNYIVSQHWSSGLRPIIRVNGVTYSYYTTPTSIFGTANVVGYGSNGTSNKAFINGVLQTKNVLAGTDTGQWMNDVVNRDNIVLFGLNTTSFTTATAMKLAFVGYLPYTDDDTIIALQNELKTIFGL